VAEPDDNSRLVWATQALFGYLDAEAVEPLLAAAAKVQDAGTRDACLAHLERIREYQDARERWATRRAKAQTREQVVSELLALLDSSQEGARVHAIKALATWEAVEAMPRLIQLTSDPSAAVALAAKQALEELSRAEPK
jgi:O-methyltransferase involved in polyketide biosynthesis